MTILKHKEFFCGGEGRFKGESSRRSRLNMASKLNQIIRGEKGRESKRGGC